VYDCRSTENTLSQLTERDSVGTTSWLYVCILHIANYRTTIIWHWEGEGLEYHEDQ